MHDSCRDSSERSAVQNEVSILCLLICFEIHRLLEYTQSPQT